MASPTDQDKIRAQVKAEIKALLMSGHTKRQIWGIIKKTYPDLPSATYRKWRSDVVKAMGVTEEELKSRKPANMGVSQHRWLYLYHLAVEKGDLKTAAKCLEKLEDRQGLNEKKQSPKKVNNNLFLGQDLHHVSTQELKRIAQQPDVMTTQEAEEVIDVEYE